MLKKVLFLLVVWIIFAIAIPMESLNEYNLVLVHGAGSHWGGLDCENGDVKHEIRQDDCEKKRGVKNMYENYIKNNDGLEG